MRDSAGGNVKGAPNADCAHPLGNTAQTEFPPVVYLLPETTGFSSNQKEQPSTVHRNYDPVAIRALLAQTGAVLLKTTIETAADFEAVLFPIVQNNGGFMGYTGGTNDRELQEQTHSILSTGTEPPHLRLREHCEMAYVDRWCGVIAFGCLSPPITGMESNARCLDNTGDSQILTGCTTLALCEDLLGNVPEEMVQKLKRLGTQNHMFYHDRSVIEGDGGAPWDSTSNGSNQNDLGSAGRLLYVKSWQDCLGVENRPEAELECAKRGWDYEWCEDGALHFWFTRPAFVERPIENSTVGHTSTQAQAEPRPVLFVTDLSGEWYKAWHPFNDWPDERRPYWFCWGDGTRLTAEEFEAWRLAEQKARRPHTWEKGDILLVDNHACMHGREPSAPDCGRKIVVGLCEPVSRIASGGSDDHNTSSILFSKTFYDQKSSAPESRL